MCGCGGNKFSKNFHSSRFSCTEKNTFQTQPKAIPTRTHIHFILWITKFATCTQVLCVGIVARDLRAESNLFCYFHCLFTQFKPLTKRNECTIAICCTRKLKNQKGREKRIFVRWRKRMESVEWWTFNAIISQYKSAPKRYIKSQNSWMLRLVVHFIFTLQQFPMRIQHLTLRRQKLKSGFFERSDYTAQVGRLWSQSTTANACKRKQNDIQTKLFKLEGFFYYNFFFFTLSYTNCSWEI